MKRDQAIEKVILAGGCFWCLQANLQIIKGVEEAICGYGGGQALDPNYKQVCEQKTDHREVVLVNYNPKILNYSNLLNIFWQNIDPTDSGGQFFDRGFSYTTAIFYFNAKQKEQALQSKKEIAKNFDKPIVTDILPYTTFYKAEEYHQDFYKKSPQRYQDYAHASGRQEYKELVWKAILKKQNLQ